MVVPRWSRMWTETMVPLCGLAALILVVFHSTLREWFTGGDTLPLIWADRLHSGNGLLRLLAEPMGVSKTFAANVGLYWRPVSMLSYSLDFAISGLHPIAYQATDLCIVFLTAIAVRWAARSVFCIGSWASWGAAYLFVLHPIMASVVPVVSRRQSLLGTLFTLLALSLLALGLEGKSLQARSWAKAGSVCATALAVGSIEAAVLVLPLLIAYVVCVPPRELRRIVALWPHAVVLGIWFGIRWLVLGGIGGRMGLGFHLRAILHTAPNTIGMFLLGNVAPVLVTLAHDRHTIGAMLVVASLVTLLAVFRKAWRPKGSANRVIVICGAWWALSVALYVITQTFDLWNLTDSVAAISIGLTFLIDAALRGRSVRAAALPCSLAVWLVGSSVFANPRWEWRCVAGTDHTIAQGVTSLIVTHPNAAEVIITNLPTAAVQRGDLRLGYMGPEGLKSWLAMQTPNVHVVIASVAEPLACSDHVLLPFSVIGLTMRVNVQTRPGHTS